MTWSMLWNIDCADANTRVSATPTSAATTRSAGELGTQLRERRRRARDDVAPRALSVEEIGDRERVAIEQLEPPTHGGQDRPGAREVPDPHPTEQRGARCSASHEHRVVGRRSERSQLADAIQTVPAMRPRVCHHERIAARRDVVERRQPRAIPPGLSADRAVALAGAGEMNDPGPRRTVLHETDADAPGRKAGDEPRRAVDRVDEEAAVSAALEHGPFLADDAHAGTRRRERRGDEPLDLPIGRGDQRAIALALRRDPSEVSERDLAGALRDRLERGSRHDRHHGLPRSSASVVKSCPSRCWSYAASDDSMTVFDPLAGVSISVCRATGMAPTSCRSACCTRFAGSPESP